MDEKRGEGKRGVRSARAVGRAQGLLTTQHRGRQAVAGKNRRPAKARGTYWSLKQLTP